MRKLLRLLSIASLLPSGVLLPGCAGARVPGLAIGPETSESLVLPPPPAAPQMRYLFSVKGSGVRQGPRDPDRRWKPAVEGEPPAFRSPIAVAEVRKGLFYVVDQANSQLVTLEPEKRAWGVREPAGDTPLVSLVGLAVDDAGAIYLTDSVLKKVFRLREGSDRLERFAVDYPFERPTGVVFNSANRNLYVVDTLASKVLAFDLSGRKVLEFGRRGEGPGELNYPTWIAVDGHGAIYVSDTLNFRVQSFAADGTFRFAFGSLGDGPGAFSAPKGVAVGPEGLVYVVDGRQDRVEAFSPAGEFRFAFGSSGTGPGQFWLPNGIYADERGRVYVCDYLNDRVQVFQYIGER